MRGTTAVDFAEAANKTADKELEGKHALVRCRFCQTPNAVPAFAIVEAARKLGDPDPVVALKKVREAAARGEGPNYKCFKCGEINPVLKSELVPPGNRRQRRASDAKVRRVK